MTENKNRMEIDINRLWTMAENLLLQKAGLDREGEQVERMRQDAFRVGGMIADRLKPEAMIMSLGTKEFSLQGDTVTAGGVQLRCRALEQLDPAALTGIVFYVCRAGSFSAPQQGITEQFYADLWGTALVDGLRAMVNEQIGMTSKISDSFGPGFYGMEPETVSVFQEILGFEQIGVSLKGSVMIPEKSCCGFVFTVNEGYRPLRKQCCYCMGNQTGCALCQVGVGE